MERVKYSFTITLGADPWLTNILTPWLSVYVVTGTVVIYWIERFGLRLYQRLSPSDFPVIAKFPYFYDIWRPQGINVFSLFLGQIEIWVSSAYLRGLLNKLLYKMGICIVRLLKAIDVQVYVMLIMKF